MQYINYAYRRTGTLWDSRYKSSAVQGETYLLTCERYIELNPVRAAMVKDPAHYPWTSTAQMRWVSATPVLHRTRSTAPWARATKNGRRLTVRYSARSSIKSRWTIYVVRSIKVSHLATRAFTRIAEITGIRREVKPRGRPRAATPESGKALERQQKLRL